MNVKKEYRINSFEDIIDALRGHPDWLEELRRIILTEELIALPQKFEKFHQGFEKFLHEEFRPLKEKVGKIDKDVAVLKQDVAVLKDDVAELKGDSFENKVRKRAASYFGKIILKCKVVGMEDLANLLEDAVERGVIGEDEKDDALNTDVVATGLLKRNKERVVLISEVSVKVDVTDVERAFKRAGVIGRVFGIPSIGVVIGKDWTVGAEEKAEKLNILLI